MPELHAGLYFVSKLHRLYGTCLHKWCFRNNFHYCTTTAVPEGSNKLWKTETFIFRKVHTYKQGLSHLQKKPSGTYENHLLNKPSNSPNKPSNLRWSCGANTQLCRNVLNNKVTFKNMYCNFRYSGFLKGHPWASGHFPILCATFLFLSIKISAYSSGPWNSIANTVHEP